MAEDGIKKKLILRKLFKDVIEKNIKECLELGEMNTENEVKLVSTIDVIKKKAAAVKKLEEEIVEITSDENLLQEMIEEGMRFEIRCKEQVTILSKNIEKTEKKVLSELKLT